MFAELHALQANPWLPLLGWAAAVALLAVALHFLVVRLSRNATTSRSTGRIVLHAVQSSIPWVLLFFGLSFVWQSADGTVAHIDGVRRINFLLLIVAVSVFAARAVSGFGEAIIRHHPYDVADNYKARGILTQTRVLTRTLSSIIVVVGVAAGLMVFPNVRELGTGLLASAGVAGLAIGLAAKPIFGNLLAGLQIAFTQPIRIDDVVIVEGEWGRIEEITRSYVVMKVWDERRLIVPLQFFIENPFQNWTRGSADILGTVMLWVDYRLPLEPLRQELARLAEQDKDWDRRVAIIQVTETSERGMQLRVLLSSSNSPGNFDLRCRVREGLIGYINAHHPQGFVQARTEIDGALQLKTSLAAAPAPA